MTKRAAVVLAAISAGAALAGCTTTSKPAAARPIIPTLNTPVSETETMLAGVGGAHEQG